jgi:hypothetical protein
MASIAGHLRFDCYEGLQENRGKCVSDHPLILGLGPCNKYTQPNPYGHSQIMVKMDPLIQFPTKMHDRQYIWDVEDGWLYPKYSPN